MVKTYSRISRFFIRRIKSIFRIKFEIKKGILCDSEWYGNNYGGFYVCPTFIDESSIVYSFGIGKDISFDNTIINKHNCTVFAFDPTPKSINWLKTQKLPDKFKFHAFGLSNKSGIANFYLPKNDEHVSGSLIRQKNINKKESILVPVKSLIDIVTELGHAKIDILKMDIEGAEFDVIDSIINSTLEVKQILVEFHYRFVSY